MSFMLIFAAYTLTLRRRRVPEKKPHFTTMAKLTAKISVVAVSCWPSPCLKGCEESKGIFRFFKGRLNEHLSCFGFWIVIFDILPLQHSQR